MVLYVDDWDAQEAISLLKANQLECRLLRRLQISDISSNRYLMFATQYKYI